MRRQDIQLLAQARKGHTASRLEVGRRYLTGADGFPKHVKTGIEYLTHSSVADLPTAKYLIAECLPLEELLAHQQLGTLEQASSFGSPAAQAKLGVWLWVRHGRVEESEVLLETSSASGHAPSRAALQAIRRTAAKQSLSTLLRVFDASGELNGALVGVMAARASLAKGDLSQLGLSLSATLSLISDMTAEVADLIVAAVHLSESSAMPLPGVSPQNIEGALELCASRGNQVAAYTLGRGLCGLSVGAIGPGKLVNGTNFRRGVGMLLRAADAGRNDAWLHLYRMHSDHSSSVANPEMARFYLEKAALTGHAEAQRKLGALLLRASATLSQSERAIEWLHRAARAGDGHAKRLLKSLVLPLEGSEAEARRAISQVERDDPLLAIRMDLSRHFGLTKLEALCVDPADGMRPWGLVVGVNPFTSRIRLSAARAIPATSDGAMDAVQRAALFFGGAARGIPGFEGDLRRRSLRQHRIFERFGLEESMFFATAASVTRDVVRLGPKWAFMARDALQSALAV